MKKQMRVEGALSIKKALFLLAIVTGIGTMVSAQDVVKPRALGLRFGAVNGASYELSYQHGLNTQNRLEFDLGIKSKKDNYNAWWLVGIYQWVWNISSISDSFNWYVGPGAKIGTTTIKSPSETKFFMAAAGNIGIEYVFDFGLQLSLDTRPEIGIFNHYNNDFLNFELALGARYQF